MQAIKQYPTKQNDDFFDIIINVFKLIKPSWNLVSEHLLVITKTLLIPLISYMLVLAIFVSNDPSIINLDAIAKEESTPTLGLWIFIVSLIPVLAYFVTAVTLIQLQGVRGKLLGSRYVLKTSFTFMPRMFLLSLAVFVAFAFGLWLLVVPGLLVLFFLSYAPFVLIDKNSTVTEALKTSYRIVRKSWKVVLGVFVMQIILSLPAQVVEGNVATLFRAVSYVLAVAYFFLQGIIYTRIASAYKSSARKSVKD